MSRNVRPWALLFACLFIFSLPGFATTINPTSATIQEHSTKQFTASTPSKWTTTCGTISSSGLLTAPLYPATSCHITAVAISGSGSATALVNIVSPIVMTPASAKTPQGKTQQFTASMPVTWIAKCGTITAGGLFTASAPVGSSCTIEAISTGTVKYTVYGYDTIALPAITISPLSPTITEGANQQFTASVASTFTASCGAITAAGLFKAPLTQSSCTVTAKASDGTGRTVATTATIKSPIVITPSSATTGHGLTQQFTANSAVKWSASCGAITTSGLFTASAAQGSACKITATAASGTAYTASVVDTIGAAPSLTISPSSPTLTEGSTQQFTASAPATWTATCGTIGAGTGAYTAPLSPGSCTITATATDGSGHVASTTAKISSPIVITPSSAATGQGQTQQFTASSAVTWSATCGTISSTGLYTASAAQGSACKITATAATGTAYTASVVDTIGAAPSLTISPSSPTLTEGSTQQFTASVPATWTATCGTIGAGTGAYTAPLSPGSCTITATATDGSGHVTSTTATIPSPLVISPITATTGQGQTQQFTANASVTWNASCGVIDANGMFTASASQGSTCTITATAASGTAYTATAQDVIGAPPAFTLSPLSPNLSENATQQFTTSQPATFAATCGSIDQNSGLYTAPLAADSCTVTATDASDTTKTASTTITVTSPMVVTPAAVTTPAEITQQFIANLPATWQSSCGTVDITGLFTAPNTPGSVCTITATATSGPAYTGTAADTAGPAPDLIIGPGAIVLNEGDTKQFTSNVPSTFSATCGTIDPNSGLYATPLITGDCTVTATATDGTGKTASAVVSVTSPLVITPASATTAQNLTQQFTANMPATWSASCGTVDATGLFTAPSVPGSICQITAIASGATAYSTTANDTIIQYPILTISPLNPSMNQADTLPFTTSIAATFTASCGTIDPSQGSYTAPLTSGTCMVTATSTDGNSQVASTSVTVTSPFVITPSTATTSQGLSQQFTANQPATWASTCGSIDSTGLYSASSAPGIACTITATAASGTAYTATAIDTVGPPVVLAIQPAAILLNENATQQFTSNVPAAFTASCGTINAGTGLYTAPLKTGSCTITAKPAFGTGSATATATVTSPLTLSPISTTTASGATQQFTANMAAAWTSSCGSITAAGLFTASGTQGSVCTITATATGGPAYTATAADTVGAPVAFTMSPTQVSLAENANQQFTATVAATWNTTCGTIGTGTGLFTAPLTPGSCTITATAADGTARTATATATVTSPITITPANSNFYALGKLQFSANMGVTWSTSCGSIVSTSGLFTSPSTAGTCTIKATASTAPAFIATTNVTVSRLNYTTFQGSNAHTGANTKEYVLTPANVNSTTFGLAWSMSLDGGIWTQPLYMNALTINGAGHNVVYETTSQDSVYAIDVDTGTQLWKRSFLSTGVTAPTGTQVQSSMNPVGIVGTPVIDPATNTMYVVAFTSESNVTVIIHRLHAIDITTGAEKPNSPVTFNAAGFADIKQMNRAALLLANGRVYVCFGGIADRAPYQGFIFAFDTATLSLSAVFNDEPNETSTGGGGIWMSAMAPSVDSSGNLYVTSGNGITDGMNNFGQSVIKLSPALGVLDHFSPYNNVAQSQVDLDLGSGGVVVVPDQTGPFAHELITCGKPTSIYVLNRDNLGKTGTTSDNIIQRVDGQLSQTSGTWRDSGHACFSTPTFWNQNLYVVSNHDVMKKFSLTATTGKLSTTPVSQGTFTYTWPGAFTTISANGNSNGIVWTYEATSGTLRATDASNVSKELFVGTVSTASKWSVPTVINGHVFVESANKIYAFAPK